MNSFAALLLTIVAIAAQAQDVAARPQVVALMAAVGDRIELVRQKRETGSHFEPYERQVLQMANQALNDAVLRGLDAAVAEDQPQVQRVLLRWTMPAELADRVEKSLGKDRQDLVLDAVTHYLSLLSERQNWDRIELVVPAYKFSPIKGMGTRLSGIGVYIQPLQAQHVNFGLGQNGVTLTDVDGDFTTVNPNTGETGNSSVYVATYMYFERLTYNAKTLELIKRQRFFSNTKYADPQSVEVDVAKQMSPDQLVDKLAETVERAAYRSIRPATSEVRVSPVKPLPAASAASPSGS